MKSKGGETSMFTFLNLQRLSVTILTGRDPKRIEKKGLDAGFTNQWNAHASLEYPPRTFTDWGLFRRWSAQIRMAQRTRVLVAGQDEGLPGRDRCRHASVPRISPARRTISNSV